MCLSICSSAVWSCVKVALLVSVLLQMRLSTLPYYIHYQIHKGKDMSFFIFLLIPCFFVFSSNLLTVLATNKILKIYHQKSSCNVDIVPSGLSGISINFHTVYFNNKTNNWLKQLCLFQVFGNLCERRQTLSNLRGEFHSFFRLLWVIVKVYTWRLALLTQQITLIWTESDNEMVKEFIGNQTGFAAITLTNYISSVSCFKKNVLLIKKNLFILEWIPIYFYGIFFYYYIL